jgi:AraC family transcriptional regulator
MLPIEILFGDRQAALNMSLKLLSKELQQIQNREISISRDKTYENGLRLVLRSDPRGTIESPAFQNNLVSIHIGSSVRISCRRGGYSHSGMAVHGDIDIIPAGVPSFWEIAERDKAFFLSIPSTIVNAAAEHLEIDPAKVELRNRFQIRDQQIENIGWALKAEMESGYPSGQLYVDSLAIAAAARLVHRHSSISPVLIEVRGRLTGYKLKQVLSYIEDNLGQNVSLQELASVSGFSVSHFKTLFSKSVGMSAHQYLIRRRVERAKSLLLEGKMSIGRIALETGFTHQSHLAYHMHRLLGLSPREIRELSDAREGHADLDFER